MYKTSSEKQWALASHLGALIGYVVPFGNIIVPLVIYLSKKDESEVIADQAKESLNFQITCTILIIISAIMILVLIGFVLLPVAILFQLIFVVLAAIVVDKNKLYRYPISVRLIQ